MSRSLARFSLAQRCPWAVPQEVAGVGQSLSMGPQSQEGAKAHSSFSHGFSVYFNFSQAQKRELGAFFFKGPIVTAAGQLFPVVPVTH